MSAIQATHRLHNHLRHATEDLHRKLDQHPILAPLNRETVTAQRYQRALLALHAISAPAEARISHYLNTQLLPLDYAARQRTPDLVKDLEHFGLSPHEPAWDGPTIASIGALIGCLYVQEGSALGGRIIFRRVHKDLGISAQQGGRFFSGYGRDNQSLWREFWNFAINHSQESDIPEACRAANEFFRSYLVLLGQYESSQSGK